MRSDRLKQVMQQIDPNFDERTAGFNRFSKFVVEAGQKGLLQVKKLENGQYEVAPSAGATIPMPAARSEEPAREEGASRRGRSRRGRGRDRERSPEAGREDGQRHPPREPRPDGALTLARAFQLMSQALGELRAPVGHEALRLRMAAMHGRQDPLLDAARFPRFLRQANDAEVADVRKVGDDEYEISPHRAGALPPPPVPGIAAPAAPAVAPAASVPFQEESAAEPSGVTRENGRRFGVRFRRGSRAPLRTGEVPLIGVVEIEPPAETATAAEPAAAAPGGPQGADKPARRRRAPRKRAAAAVTAGSTPSASSPPEGAEAPPKRPRARARKKAE
jgi:hypothetical protein